MSERYERVYDVGLLDDLHNYFPALLYNQTNFRTVPDVLRYIHDRTTERFNLFDYGRRQYEHSLPTTNTYVPQQQQQQYQTRFAQPQHQTRFAQPRPLDEVRVEFTNASSSASSLLPLFHSLGLGLGGSAATAGAARSYQDVIVHASQNAIDVASTEEILVEDLESICTICQDRLRQGELTRKLTVCGHSFHKPCIDHWLLNRSVRCPTCRHDIRELALVRSTPPSPLLTATAPASIAHDTAIPSMPSTGTGTRLRQRDTDSMSSNEIINLLFGRIV